MKAQNLSQVALAEKLGTTQPALSRSLKSAIINPQSQWAAILEALGLELVVRPKTDVS